MADVEVRVLWPLQGDQRWSRGDVRTLSEADAKRLAESGAVEIIKAEKAALTLKNKIDRKVENKDG